MKMIRKAFAMILVFAFVLAAFSGLPANEDASAASKPGKASITLKAGSDGKSVVITIAKTKGAKGYQIAVKKPGAKKFSKLATVKQDGTAVRTYTANNLAAGKYTFKVRAYTNSGKKTVYGKYGKASGITIGTSDTGSSGSGEAVYISTQKELAGIDTANAKAKYILKNDIDMKGWTTLEKVYCSIDGAGHTLKNLTVPFIGALYGGTVENVIFDLKLTGVYRLYDYKMVAPIGFLAGGNGLEDIGTVRNCKSVGSINCKGGEDYDPYDYNDAIEVGGIVAFNPNNMGYIERCKNEADITIMGFPNAAIGGIIGMTGGGSTRVVISECHNAGNIETDTEWYTQSYCGIGGICGNIANNSFIRDCLNTGDIKKTESSEYYDEAHRMSAGICGVQACLENCVSLGSAAFGLCGNKISANTVNIWSYSDVKHFTNTYYSAAYENGLWWEGDPVEIEGIGAVEDITDESAFAGLDFKKIWKMGNNGPELRNLP